MSGDVNLLPEILESLGKGDPVGILSVGTEITRGEILNRNSKWLSEKLDAANLSVVLHMSVSDDRQKILAALNALSENVKHIFVTGGLGPTSDDFTRNVIADWTGNQLKYSDKEEDKVQKILSQRNVAFKESHKQQCFFPENSAVLENRAGTASGFAIILSRNQSRSIWAFPGPPHELKSVFSIALDEHLENLSAMASPHFFAYRILGLPESEVADCVEKLFAEFNCELAYRASSPYVLVKILTLNASLEFQSALSQLEELMGDYLVGRGLEDPVKLLLAELTGFARVSIQDGVTQYYLSERLAGFREELKGLNELEIFSSPKISPSPKPLKVLPKDEKNPHEETVRLKLIQKAGEWEVGIDIYRMSSNSQSTSQQEEALKMSQSQPIAPFSRYKFGSEFGIRYVAEKSILFWTKALQSRE